MELLENDYVYVPKLKGYGIIVGIDETHRTYRVSFVGSSYGDRDFEESKLVKLEVPDFKEGDKVTGIKGAKRYSFTTESAIMEVLWVKEKSMRVKILSHETKPYSKGSLYTVNPVWFKLVRPRTNFYRG